MKFIFIKDVHLSHRGPVSRTDDWQESIFAKLDQVAKLAVHLKVAAVLIGGDIFHHKTRIAYGTVYRLLDWCAKLRDQKVYVLAIPGNHDEVNDRLESVPTQPIGLLFRSGLVTDVSYQRQSFVPADEEAGPAVDVVGVPYPEAGLLENWQKIPAAQIGDRTIVLAHCFASPSGGTCFGEPCLSYADLSTLPYDVFCFGHDHADHGVTQFGSKFFVNIGALSRGTLAKEDIERPVQLALIDVGETTTIMQVNLKVAPAAEVFDLSLKAQKDREHDQIEQFVGDLSADLLSQTGNLSFKDRVAGMDLAEGVRAKVLEYIQQAEGVQP